MLALAGVGICRAAELPQTQPSDEPVSVRVHGAPDTASPDPLHQARVRSIAEFQRQNPWIRLTPATGVEIEARGGAMVTLMQIAGEVAPDALHVDLGIIDSYIDQGFLTPLDEYLEHIPREELLARAPDQIWEALTHVGPDGKPHVYALPMHLHVSAMFYRRALFRQAGLPDRPPADWAELDQFCRAIKQKTGSPALGVPDGDAEVSTLSNLMIGTGARVIAQDSAGRWRCAFASPETAKAAVQYAKLLHLGWAYRGADWRLKFDNDQVGMIIQYVDRMVFTFNNPDLVGVGPLFKGPTGLSSTRIYCNMKGLFAGTKTDAQREGAWRYMRWLDSPDDRRIQVQTLVEHGYGGFVNPEMLRQFGFAEYAEHVPAAWARTLTEGLSEGQPDFHGEKINEVLRELNRPLGDIVADAEIKRAILSGDIARAEARALEHLHRGQSYINERVYGTLKPEVQKSRNRIAGVVAIAVLLLFAGLTVWVLHSFRLPEARVSKGGGFWQFWRYRWAYLILLPGFASVLLWQYYPLLRGSVMAFQDYRVMGGGRFVGMENFAKCLYDAQFWYSIWVSIKYATIYMTFGFFAPIVLAILLQETPIGKVFFRTVFYLPAVLAGIVVVLLWKQFYDLNGVLNAVIQLFTNWPPALMVPAKALLIIAASLSIYILLIKPLRHPNRMERGQLFVHLLLLLLIGGWLVWQLAERVWATGLPGMAAGSIRWLVRPWDYDPISWLTDRRTALIACILPVIWVGMGPGCLIYLAALKTIPDELYESADIDGASPREKIFHVMIPSIKGLIIINFIGAFIGAFRTAGLILPMTGGGPTGTYNATEVVGLHIYYTTFLALKFGLATAMAWILGAMLIGFTMVQLRRLSRMEYTTAEARTRT